jgi:hypothetical protein
MAFWALQTRCCCQTQLEDLVIERMGGSLGLLPHWVKVLVNHWAMGIDAWKPQG